MKFKDCKIGMVVVPSAGSQLLSEDGNAIYNPNFRTLKISRLNYTNHTITVRELETDFEMKNINPIYVNEKGKPTFLFGAKLDFEIHTNGNELAAYYHGIKIATAKCRPDDAYDEEFGLNLLLRRVCQKLKDSHTVVETVEELLKENDNEI